MADNKENCQSKTIALHSYKGGTGKTTLITNIAAYYAMIGLKVCLLDFDLYAPSLSMYFRKEPLKSLNDLLKGDTDISKVLMDVSSELGLPGKLYLGFSSARKEDISEIEMKHDLKWQLAAIRRVLAAKNHLFDDLGIDYLLLDTSPGIRYWSINTLAVADYLLLVMKNSDMDIEGTKKMTNDIYDALTKFGSKYFLVLNKVAGASPVAELNLEASERNYEKELETEMGARVVGSIPCFCDIQFSRHEFLFSIKKPAHPFSKKVVELAEKIRTLG
ncbi:MAG TPA: MinD/ParA family protein [Candidatus Nanoarchaeia archaeon]|nr:MinD/ParA family protein [Candidatus Nanoarchaeia archaeon]